MHNRWCRGWRDRLNGSCRELPITTEGLHQDRQVPVWAKPTHSDVRLRQIGEGVDWSPTVPLHCTNLILANLYRSFIDIRMTDSEEDVAYFHFEISMSMRPMNINADGAIR